MDESTVREGESTVREGGPTAREPERTVREGSGAALPAVGESAEEEVAGWLPGPLAAEYRVIESLPARGGEADLYVLDHRRTSPGSAGDTRRVAKVYRHGIAPKEDVIRRVQAAAPAHVVRLEDYGRDAGRWWELMEYVERGSLRVLIEEEGPRLPADLVRSILRQVNEALAGLHALPLEHRDLKPANVLVRSRRPLDLIVTDFGISSLMDASRHFTLAARSIRYAPPESIGVMVSGGDAPASMIMIEHTKWDYWSLGMMAVEMLRGTHPYDGLADVVISNQLVTQNVDQLAEGISDPAWRRLCRGLLRRTPSARWDAEAVSKWLADPDDPSLAVAEEAAAPPPGAVQLAPAAGIAFDGASFATTADLGAALAEEWEKAESFWKRRYSDVHTWVTDGLGLGPVGKALAEIDDSDLSLDAQVFSFVYLLAPNAPVRFRDLDLTAEGIAELCGQAAERGNAVARARVLGLYRNGILGLAAPLPGAEGLAEVSRRWDEAVGDHNRIRSGLRGRAVVVPELDDGMLVRLLGASIPGSPTVAALRERAHRASTEDALRCPWFRDFGTPEEMPVAVLCMLPHLVGPARKEGRLRKMRLVRGCVGGMVVGGLFGRLVRWADTPGLDLGIDRGFWELAEGVFLVAQVTFALYLAVPWYRAGISRRLGQAARPRSARSSGALLSGQLIARRGRSAKGPKTMRYLILIALVVLVVALVVGVVVRVVAQLALIVTAPSIAAMRLVRLAGLTDPVWYEVVHALLGATAAMGAHLAGPRVAQGARRPRRPPWMSWTPPRCALESHQRVTTTSPPAGRASVLVEIHPLE